MSRRLPRIVLTVGEPAGIGPDITVHLAQQPFTAEIVAIADPNLLLSRADRLELPLEIEPFDAKLPPAPHTMGLLKVLPVPLRAEVNCGHLNQANARYVLETLDRACSNCLEGRFDALVTAPVHKGIINAAGIPFTGHTEYLAHASGGHQPVMMLCAQALRVALATTHVPLAEVSRLITRDHLCRVLQILAHDLRRRFGIQKPRIAVCGLNPHAGEGGYLGTEELEHIAPAIAALRSKGLDLRGPLPADTVFVPRHLEDLDAVLAMYHDQGLPVLKYRGFGEAVNVTLGLPLIRTSVDHGTALDRAGTGQAEPGSLLAALQMAIDLVQTEHGAGKGEDPWLSARLNET